MNAERGGVIRKPGVIHTIEGNTVDLLHYKPEDVNVRDLAWGCGRTLRYGGHIREDFTVAHHAVIMSYLVDEEYALEALHHDSAEALIGDIIWPVKVLFPEIAAFENAITDSIMKAFDVETAGSDDGKYVKSEAIETADRKLLEHESFSVGRAGVYHQDVEDAWLKAAQIHEVYWYAPQYVFLQRHYELMGEENPHELDLKKLTDKWFPNQRTEPEMAAELKAALEAL